MGKNGRSTARSMAGPCHCGAAGVVLWVREQQLPFECLPCCEVVCYDVTCWRVECSTCALVDETSRRQP